MSARTRVKRIFGGLALVLIVLIIGFSVTSALIYNWGSTSEEVAAVYPGDEIYPEAQIVWTHGATYHARPEQVWPWIIQIGDSRGGFYSHTFIENLIDPEDSYNNADRIVAEWQNPPIGQGMIMDYTKIKQIQAGDWLLADTSTPLPGFGMSWLWTVQPQGLDSTRMVVRLRIQLPPEMDNPAVRGIVHVGGFVMEQGMIRGLKDRVEGHTPPVYFEAIGIALWLLAFALGVVSAVLFVKRPDWKHPLVAGLGTVVVLFILTFVQPALWVRLLLDALLIGGVVWAGRERRSTGGMIGESM